MTQLLFLGGIGIQELLIVLLTVLLLYGGKKVPEMMRGLGQGVKAFKDGMNDTVSAIEENKEEKKEEEKKE